MVRQVVSAADRGQRLDKYIKRILPNAGSSFIYKMLRKKNITLNDGKADGKELLQEGDTVTFWFSEETYEKFAGADSEADHQSDVGAYLALSRQYPDIQVIYEQSELVFVQKPAGVLTQKAKDRDQSLNEWLLGYLITSGQLPATGNWSYTPSVCNRLDRNTGGIVICAKTLLGSRTASQLLRDRSVHKYYHMIVMGELTGSGTIEGWTTKDDRTNEVTFHDHEVPGSAHTRTIYQALRYSKANDLTLVEAELVTGKAHQLRVHLQHIGHPILGDPKYGSKTVNLRAASRGVRGQLLWSQRLVLPTFNEPELADLSGRTITCDPPAIFKNILM